MRKFLDGLLGPLCLVCGGYVGTTARTEGWFILSGVLMGFGTGWLLRWLLEEEPAW